MPRLRAIALCVLLLLTVPATAGPYEEGVEAYDRKDYATALKLWLPLAEQGNAAAQFNIAVLYEKGLGVEQDMYAAARWYRKAAEQGDIEAQYDLGRMYETGSGLPIDANEARRWYARVLASPATDTTSTAIKQRTRARVAELPPLEDAVVPYKGGRFVIARGNEGACVVALQGAITKDAASSFDEVIKRSSALGCATPWLLLESPGGLLDDSIALGEAIRRAGYRTITRYSCASACAILFLGGSERVLVGSRARIGLHQPALVGGAGRRCDPTSYSSAARDTASYLKSVIPAHADEVMHIILDTSCDDITWIGGTRAIALTIATRVESENVDVYGPAGRRAR